MVRGEWPGRRSGFRIAAASFVFALLPVMSGGAEGATTRVEAESLSSASSCWSVLQYGRFSGGAARTCYSTGAPLTWTVDARAGDVVRLYGYRDAVARSFRVRIDGGAWVGGTLTGPEHYSSLFYTSPGLGAGSHIVEVEWVNSAGALTLDFYEVSDGATTTTSADAAPTTNAPPPNASSRVEAEALAHSGPCWSVLSYSRFSGAAGRSCYTVGAPLRWSVTTAEGGVVRLYGYRDAVSRGYRVRVDGGAWAQGTLGGAEAYSELFFTSPPLIAGSHTLELEWVSSAGGLTLDFYEVAGAGTAPSPTTTTTTTSTTAPPTTTTTTQPPTTPTTAAPTSGGVCRITPADGEAAITAAIAACPDGSTVQFPAGAVYRQSHSIDVADRANLVIDGGGSTFVSSAPNVEGVNPNWRLARVRNVTLRNMTVEGNFKLTGPRSLATVSAISVNQRNSGFFLYGGRDVTIADVKVKDIFGDGITTVPSKWAPSGMTPTELAESEIPSNIRVLRLQATRVARQCVAPTAVDGFWLEDSVLRDCWYGGVDFERDVTGEPQRNAHVLRNTFDGFNLFAIAGTAPGNTGDTNGVEIRGNKTLTPGDTCIPTVIFGYYPENPNRLLNIVIEDNEIRTLYNGVTFDHVEGGAIRNNRIEKLAPDSLCGPPAGLAVKVTNSINVVVGANTVVGFAA